MWNFFWVFYYVWTTGEYTKVKDVVVKLNPRLQIVQDSRGLIYFMRILEYFWYGIGFSISLRVCL